MTTSITNTLLNQRNEILQEWLRQQLSAQNLRADLISEAELRSDSNQFLSALSDAVQSGNLIDILDPEYKPVLEMLEGVSRSRGLQGFTPSETATFVFSFKQPLFSVWKTAASVTENRLFVAGTRGQLVSRDFIIFIKRKNKTGAPRNALIVRHLRPCGGR